MFVIPFISSNGGFLFEYVYVSVMQIYMCVSKMGNFLCIKSFHREDNFACFPNCTPCIPSVLQIILARLSNADSHGYVIFQDFFLICLDCDLDHNFH